MNKEKPSIAHRQVEHLVGGTAEVIGGKGARILWQTCRCPRTEIGRHVGCRMVVGSCWMTAP